MKITNWKHLPWFLFVSLATIAASLLYVANFHHDRLPPGIWLPASLIQTPTEHHTVGGTPLGLAFGAISLAIFVFAALLSLRKKIPLWRIGTVQRWLRAHIWLTFLTIPLIVLHSGFRLGGPMTTLLMVLYALVMASGIYGLVLQHLMPRLMKEQLPAEKVFEQIPHIRAQLCVAAEEMRDSFKPALLKTPDAHPSAASPAKAGPAGSAVMASTATTAAPAARAIATSPEPIPSVANAAASPAPTKPAPSPDPESEAALVEFIDRQILPYLQARRGERFRLGNARFSDETFRFAKLRVAETYRSRVDEIQGWCDERRMLDLQVRLQHWLHGWLFVHVPFSFLLLMLTIWHAYVTLFYY
jgi:hypothetical protein